MAAQIKNFYYTTRKWFLAFGMLTSWPIFWFLIRRRKAYFAKNPSLRILIIPQLTRIGDVVCATPVFRSIKEQYPDSFIAVLVTSRIFELLKHNPNIDEIIQFRTSHFMNMLRIIRSKKFNWSMSLSGTMITTIIAVWSLIPGRAKITRQDKPLGERLTDWLIPDKLLYHHHTYLPKYYLKLLKYLNINHPEEIRQVFTTISGDEIIKKWLFKKGISDSDLLVGISIAAQNRIKEWGDEKFKEVAKYINRKYKGKIIFLGIKKDESRIMNVLKNLDPNYFFMATDFTLEELPSLIKRLNVYIAVDTGPIYIAHALKVPLIDITGPCDPYEQPPNDKISIQVRPPEYIEPSSFVMKKAGKDEEHKKALAATSIESVEGAIDQLMKNLKKKLAKVRRNGE